MKENRIKYWLSVDYDEEDVINSYRGIEIHEDKILRVKINSGNIKLDEDLAIHILNNIIEDDDDNSTIQYMSSYDNYFMDLDIENDPVLKAEVEKNAKLIGEFMSDGKTSFTIAELNEFEKSKQN